MYGRRMSHLIACIITIFLLVRAQGVFGQTQQQQGSMQGLMQSQGLQGALQQQSQKTAWYWHYRLTNYRNTLYTRSGKVAVVKNGRLRASASQNLSLSRVRVLNGFRYRPRTLHFRPNFSRPKGVGISRSAQRIRVRLPRRAR